MPIRAFAFDAYGTLFDTRSVLSEVETRFPRRGKLITQLWRLKQLEYSWLRTVMGRYADFATVTREALRFALDAVAPEADDRTVDTLCGAFDRLQLYGDVDDALSELRPYRLTVFSNGSPAMLEALLTQAGCRHSFDRVVSTAAARVFKPHPDAYRALTEALGLPAEEIALVSSNGFDLAGAKSFGLKTVRVARMMPQQVRDALGDMETISPDGMFAAQRAMADDFMNVPDETIASLRDLPTIARAIAAPGASS